MDNASGTSDELYDELTKKNNTLDKIAELMDCQPDDDADLCEAVRLLVAESDKYRQQRNALDRENKKLRARLRELGEET